MMQLHCSRIAPNFKLFLLIRFLVFVRIAFVPYYFLLLCCLNFFLYFVYVLQWIERDMFNVWNYPNYVPKCISGQLKSCTVKFDDTVVDLQIAKYILKNTPLLEDMKITIFNAMVVKYAFQELASCSILSPICKISILGQNSMPWF